MHAQVEAALEVLPALLATLVSVLPFVLQVCISLQRCQGFLTLLPETCYA